MSNEVYYDQKIISKQRKRKWIGLIIVASIVVGGIGKFADSLISIEEVGESVVQLVPGRSIRTEAELITDTRGIYFFSTEDLKDTYSDFDPFSESDIAAVLNDARVVAFSGDYIPIKVRIVNLSKDKLLNVEEVKIEVEDYTKTVGSDIELHELSYAYTAGAPQAYNAYQVTLDPSRSVYNALTFPVIYDIQNPDFEDGLVGKIYHQLLAGDSDFLAIKVFANSPGIYRFSVKLKYSIDGVEYETSDDQHFSLLSLPKHDSASSLPYRDRASYTIQVGAFSDAENVFSLLTTLQARGYPAFVEKSDHEGLSFVRVGTFVSRSEAEQFVVQTEIETEFSIYIRERQPQ